MKYFLLSLLMIVLGSSTIPTNKSSIRYYNENDSINFLIGYGRIHYRNGDSLTTKFYNDVYKDLIIIKDSNKYIVNTPKEIDYIIIRSHQDTTKNILLAPLNIGIANGFFGLQIIGEIGFVTKIFISDYVNDVTGTTQYRVNYEYFMLINGVGQKINNYWRIKKDIIPKLPKHRDRMNEIYDEMEYSKFDKRHEKYVPEKIKAVRYLFEEYNKMENPNYINYVNIIKKTDI